MIELQQKELRLSMMNQIILIQIVNGSQISKELSLRYFIKLYENIKVRNCCIQIKLYVQKKQEEIREKRFGSKINKTFSLDFAGRRIIDDKQNIDLKNYSEQIEEILNEKTNKELQKNIVVNTDIKGIVPKVIYFVLFF